MTTYTVQMGQVDYIVGEMNSITQRLNQTLSDLDNQSKVNLAEWTSDAQSTYTQVKAQWDTAAADMTAKVAAAIQMLGQINEYYANGERQGVQLWGDPAMPGGTPMPKSNKNPPKPPYQPKQYGDGTNVPTGSGTYTNHAPFKAPPPPTGHGSGKGTTVDTPSLDLFATNIDQLVTPVSNAQKALAKVGVQPGAFYHANKMRNSVNGLNQDDGLKEQLVKVLADLSQGLSDLTAGIRTLSAKYKTIEAVNSASAKDLQGAFQATEADFTTLVTDSGGKPAPSGNSGST